MYAPWHYGPIPHWWSTFNRNGEAVTRVGLKMMAYPSWIKLPWPMALGLRG